MPPRPPHPGDIIKLPFFSISVDGAIRILDRLGKFSASWMIIAFVLTLTGIATARYGDPAAVALIDGIKANAEQVRALTKVVERLNANDSDREKRDEIMGERMAAILSELQKANAR